MNVTVKDLMDFLGTFDPRTHVLLDHDGWMEEDIDTKDVQTLIRQRGLFQTVDQSKFGGTVVLIINN